MPVNNLSQFVKHLVAAAGVESEELGLVPQNKSEVSARSEIAAAGFITELFDTLYDSFNGQTGSINLFGEFQLLSFDESMVQWEDNYSNFGSDESASCSSKIRSGLSWRKLWFPFAWDSIRNRLLILDFDPSPNGNFGQVFLYDCRQTPGRYLADSLGAFLMWYWSRLSESGYELDDFNQFVAVDPQTVLPRGQQQLCNCASLL